MVASIMYQSYVCWQRRVQEQQSSGQNLLANHKRQTIKDTIAYDINIKNGSQNFVVSLLVIKQIQRLRVEIKAGNFSFKFMPQAIKTI